MNTKIPKESLLFAVATFAYIVGVVNVINYAMTRFGQPQGLKAPIMFLTLFVISAAITSSLVFGKPAMLYFDDKKKEGIQMAIGTVVFLILIAVIFFGFLLIR